MRRTDRCRPQRHHERQPGLREPGAEPVLVPVGAVRHDRPEREPRRPRPDRQLRADHQLASCHLAPSSPERRLAEAESFALIEEHGTLIAGGDWNALPAGDPEPPRPVSGKHRRKLDRRAAEALEELGLLDVGSHMRDTAPTVGHASKLPYRCDRLYTSLPPETTTGYEVITTVDAESDHRPVIAEFDLTRAAGHDDR